ncbi:5087_t:CDS:2 [Acaulospora morrowiae]|uniref:5087_t:CDS:1 n=1 Tax=Acaulospora morrowiae TaxID=94023 RepID=A0A9N8WR00_9GLOM|nr:5087_t:CDS:2 [Acaulospora morrowiae]
MPPTRSGREYAPSVQSSNLEVEWSQKSKSQGTRYPRKDPYSKLESELRREKDHLMLILEHIDNQKLKLKTEETVLLAMLNIHDPTTSIPMSTNGFNTEVEGGGTLIVKDVDGSFKSALANSPSIPCLSPVSRQSQTELMDNTSQELNGLSSPVITTFRSSDICEGSVVDADDEPYAADARSDVLVTTNSTDMEIANALSILENMSDCEDVDVDEMANERESSPVDEFQRDGEITYNTGKFDHMKNVLSACLTLN